MTPNNLAVKTKTPKSMIQQIEICIYSCHTSPYHKKMSVSQQRHSNLSNCNTAIDISLSQKSPPGLVGRTHHSLQSIQFYNNDILQDETAICQVKSGNGAVFRRETTEWAIWAIQASNARNGVLGWGGSGEKKGEAQVTHQSIFHHLASLL